MQVCVCPRSLFLKVISYLSRNDKRPIPPASSFLPSAFAFLPKPHLLHISRQKCKCKDSLFSTILAFAACVI